MTDSTQPSRTGETRGKVRSGRREIPSDVLPAPNAAAHLQVKGFRARPGRPVHTVRVSAVFL
ncbi:hypothetical protein [Streptomyces sp. NPDC048623]|uniref:hypothetical protein n=1 Tax=Streptomyces sp. NPDC048623 TaxID=3155761 RepID=UPI0034298559